MPRTSAAAFRSPLLIHSGVAVILVAGAFSTANGVYARLAAVVDQAGRRESARPDGDAERKLLADLARVQGAAAEDFDLQRFDRDMAAAFRRMVLISTASTPRP